MCVRRLAGVILGVLVETAFFAQEVDQTTRPIVKDIAVTHVANAQVKVSWRLPQEFSAASILIFKDTQPFVARNQIMATSPVAQVKPTSTYFVDKLMNYKEYYYAVIAKKADGSLYDVVLPSINATVSGIRAKREVVQQEDDVELQQEKIYADGQMRELPLPYLEMLDEQHKPNPLKKEVLAAGAELAGEHTHKHISLLSPYIFEEDMIAPAGGDDYFLFEILKNYFIRKDYKNSVEQLQKFLTVNRDDKVTNRAVFYLAESFYYRKNYRQALNLFLFIEDEVPVVSKKWIESTLDLYQMPDELK
ncbi:MAG: hypothetical protein IJP62_13620 [Treponema sp.]|nr:hypothetical protein [Treponema sp.]